MSKRKPPQETKKDSKAGRPQARTGGKAASTYSSGERRSTSIGDFFSDRGVRETIESIVVAIILALLFRAYEAEAFVIPTGSMAPTLQGRHKDVFCPKCGFEYQTGASSENPDSPNPGAIRTTTCPMCRYAMRLNPAEHPNQASFSGDRIIVSKFAYDIGAPERWDVIVFKYPGNAKQNYIKRLVGLPGETLYIEKGDVFTRRGDDPFQIARKERPSKLRAMLQLVDDTHYIGEELQKVGWPSRWQQWDSPVNDRAWTVEPLAGSASYSIEGEPNSGETKWLRYRHLPPRGNDWETIESGSLPSRDDNFRGELIADYYAYNDFIVEHLKSDEPKPTGDPPLADKPLANLGLHWVGDLGVECDVEVRSNEGALVLDLVESGTHFSCTIDLKTGTATLATSNPSVKFDATGSSEGPSVETSVRGPGRYRLMLTNVDDEVSLWIGDTIVAFDEATTYTRPIEDEIIPQWTASDPGDAEPVGIGVQGATVKVNRLKVLRDVYYVAVDSRYRTTNVHEYQTFSPQLFQLYDDQGRKFASRIRLIRYIFEHPETWNGEGEELFRLRNRNEYDDFFLLDDKQLFPMGDNSPQSLDARLWDQSPQAVDKDMLIGKALFVYWPHAWNRPPFWPNFKRMGFIH